MWKQKGKGYVDLLFIIILAVAEFNFSNLTIKDPPQSNPQSCFNNF